MMLFPKTLMTFLCLVVVLCFLPPAALAATSFQKVCQGGGIASVAAARTMCQGISPSHFLATPFSAADDAAIKALLGGVTALLGASCRVYTNVYAWEDGPRNGETLVMLVSPSAYVVNGYYHGFTGSVTFGATYVLGIDSTGWKSLSSTSTVTCAICASRPAIDVCDVAGTQTVVSGDWLSAASCTCRTGYRGSDCSLQFQSYCDGPYGTLDAYDAQCTARGMYLATPDTQEEVWQVGRSIPQHLTVYYLLGGTKDLATGYWSWGYGPNKGRSFFDEVSRQNVNYWVAGEAVAGGTDTNMVQFSSRGWYDQSAMGTCYTCQMQTCDVACNVANTLSSSGSTWPACTCTCKPGWYGPTCDCPVYGCYEPGLLTMEWQPGTLDKCSCVCKPKFFAPYCYPTPTISLEATTSLTMSTSGTGMSPSHTTHLTPSVSLPHTLTASSTSSVSGLPSASPSMSVSPSPTPSVDTNTPSLAASSTDSEVPTASNSLSPSRTASLHTSSPTLTSIHSQSLSLLHTASPSTTYSIIATHTSTYPPTASKSSSLNTPSSTPTTTLSHSPTPSHTNSITSSPSGSIPATSSPTHTPTPSLTSTATHSHVSTPSSTESVSSLTTPTQLVGIAATATATLSHVAFTSSLTPTSVFLDQPFSQRPSCPSTSLSWYRMSNTTLIPTPELTDQMFRNGEVVVNVSLLTPDVQFRGTVDIVSFGVESVGVTDPRSFPTSVNLADVECVFAQGSVRSILCSFPASPDYTIRTSETLSVRVAVDGTSVGTCRSTEGYFVAGTVVISPAKVDALLQSIQAAFAVVASITTAIIIIFADGSPIETQVLVMMMDSPCASNIDRASVEWIKYIVMPASDGGITWMMGGNILIATSFLILHSLIVFILYQVRLYRFKKLKRTYPKNTKQKQKSKKTKSNSSKKVTIVERSKLVRDTCTTLMYPGISLNIGLVMYAGVSYGTMGILRTQSGLSATVAAAGLLYMLLVPACVLYILMKVATVVYHRYNWADEDISKGRRWLYPHGFWAPKEQMFRLQGALGPYRAKMHMGVLFPILLAALMGVLLNGLAGMAPCDYLYVAVGVICLLSGLIIALLNPLRSTVQSALTAICLISLGVIAVLQIVAIRTGLEILVTLKGVANYILIAGLAVRTAHSIFVFIVEYRHKDVIIEQMKECGEVMSEVSEKEGAEEADHHQIDSNGDIRKPLEVVDECPINGQNAPSSFSSTPSSRRSIGVISSGTLEGEVVDRDVEEMHSFLDSVLDDGYTHQEEGGVGDKKGSISKLFEGFSGTALQPSPQLGNTRKSTSVFTEREGSTGRRISVDSFSSRGEWNVPTSLARSGTYSTYDDLDCDDLFADLIMPDGAAAPPLRSHKAQTHFNQGQSVAAVRRTTSQYLERERSYVPSPTNSNNNNNSSTIERMPSTFMFTPTNSRGQNNTALRTKSDTGLFFQRERSRDESRNYSYSRADSSKAVIRVDKFSAGAVVRSASHLWGATLGRKRSTASRKQSVIFGRRSSIAFSLSSHVQPQPLYDGFDGSLNGSVNPAVRIGAASSGGGTPVSNMGLIAPIGKVRENTISTSNGSPDSKVIEPIFGELGDAPSSPILLPNTQHQRDYK